MRNLLTLIVFVLSVNCVSNRNKDERESESRTLTQNKTLVRTVVEQFWSGQFDQLDSIIADQYTIHSDPGDPWEGKTLTHKDFKKRIQDTRKVFPDLRFAIKEMIAESDKVVVSWVMSGTMKGSMNGIAPNNKKMQAKGLTIYTVNKGQVWGHWQVFDRLSVYQQLGS